MQESATGWVNVLWKIRKRGGDRIGLIITDVLKGCTAMVDSFHNVPPPSIRENTPLSKTDKVINTPLLQFRILPNKCIFIRTAVEPLPCYRVVG